MRSAPRMTALCEAPLGLLHTQQIHACYGAWRRFGWLSGGIGGTTDCCTGRACDRISPAAANCSGNGSEVQHGRTGRSGGRRRKGRSEPADRLETWSTEGGWSSMDAKLRVIGPITEQAIQMPRGKLLIGRAEDCDFRLNSEVISGYHCVLLLDDYTLRIRDLASKNGTRVNGRPIGTGSTILCTTTWFRSAKLTSSLTLFRQLSGRCRLVQKPGPPLLQLRRKRPVSLTGTRSRPKFRASFRRRNSRSPLPCPRMRMLARRSPRRNRES